MADDMMVLVCTICRKKKNSWAYNDGACHALAKAYVGGAFYVPEGSPAKDLTAFLERHWHPEVAGAFNGHNFRIEYEDEPPTGGEEK